MSDEKAKDTIRKLCGEMAWEHFDQNADPPVELWRVDMERRFVGRQIRQSNWFASKQAADDYARVQTERGSVLMSIVEYHADPAAEIAGLRAENERLRDERDNCAQLVKRLARALSLASQGDPPKLCEQAFDYLQRKGLQGSILREDENQ